MSKKITELSTVTHAAGDKVVIYDSSAGDVALVDASNLLTTVSATNRVLGRSTAGAGSIEEIVCNQTARDVMAAANAAAARIVLGGGTNTLVKLKDSTSTRDAIIDNAALTAAREFKVPNVAGELVIEPTTPSYWLKAFSDTRRPDQWVNTRVLTAFSPNSASFTLTPAQVPVKTSTLGGTSLEWKAQALWCVSQFANVVGNAITTDFNDGAADSFTSAFSGLLTSSTYCSNPLTNVVTGDIDTDNAAVTTTPSWAADSNQQNIIRCVVSTNGTDIYYFNMMVVMDKTTALNQTLLFETANSWTTIGTGGAPTLRSATSLVATSTLTEILVNNNKVRADNDGLVLIAATVRFPV